MEEKEIIDKLWLIDDKEDRIYSVEKKFEREEEEEEERLFQEYAYIENMRENCSESDKEIQELLDEKQYLLDRIRIHKSEFADEFYAKMKEEKQKIDMEREELRSELKKIQEKE